ncbi:MAG: TonB-dependent receptor [Ignavibacteria bacterium]
MIRPFALFYCLLLLIFEAVPAAAQTQNTGILRGFLSDSLSGEALPFGNIQIKELNEGTFSDNRGYFLFPSVPAGEYTITVSYIGYGSKLSTIIIKANETALLNVELAPVTIEIQPIEKVAERVDKKKSDLGTFKATIKELEAIPQGVETDILRSIQNVPGVTFVNDIAATYFVHGGSSNQNLVLLNNSVLYNPFHALGIFSIMDPEMINSLEFYKGGFPTEYSDRTSSVLDLTTKDGNKNRIGASVAVGLLTAKAAVEGPIPDGSFIVTGRKSISNSVLKNFYNNKNLPVDFYDMSFKINYSNQKFWKDAKFIVHGFFSDDHITDSNPQKANYKWKNGIYGIRYFQFSDSPLFYELSYSVSNFSGLADPKLSQLKPKRNEVKDHTFRGDYKYFYKSKDILSVGLKISDIRTDLFLQNSLGEIGNIGPSETTNDWSLYVKYQFFRFENLGIELGSRINLIKLSRDKKYAFPFEPRFSLAYALSSGLKIQTSAGIYNQSLTTLSDEDEIISVFEPWLIVPAYIGTTKSFHYAAGFDMIASDFFDIKIEGYYKKTVNIPLVNKNKIFPTDPDLVSAFSRAYGSELYSRITFGGISFISTYSLAWVKYTSLNVTYSPRFDIRHSLNLLLQVDAGAGLSFSVMWNYKSGFPFTKLLGYYPKFQFDDAPDYYSVLDNYYRFTLLDKRNTGQTPSYHRLDLSITKRITWQYFNITIDISVLNLYNRENLFYFDRETGERVNMLPFLPSITIKAEI